jgi:pilus assembly protein TadC
VPEAGLASGALLLLAAVAVVAPSTRESAARRLRFVTAPKAAARKTFNWRSPVLSRSLLRRLADQTRRPTPARMSAFATELVAACLDAGATPAAALEAAGAHLPDALGDALTSAAKASAEGAPTEEALPEDGALGPIAAVFRRSSQTGSAMSEQLIGVAAQLRADEQFERLAKAHRVAVLSALPLGLCMLPAFLLLAVVPAIVGLGSGLLP